MEISAVKRKPVIFFISSILFFSISLAFFNNELNTKPHYSTYNLKTNKTYKIKITNKNIKTIRVLIHRGSNRKLSNFNIPITVKISGDTGTENIHHLRPKSASTGGGRRYYSILNYGIFTLPSGDYSKIEVSVSNEVNKFEKFTLFIKVNPNNLYVYLFTIIFLILLYGAIKYREFTFKGKHAKILPYTLYFFVALIVLSWNI